MVAYRRKVAEDKVAVGLASQHAKARGVGARPPVANLLFGPENKQAVALVELGQQPPCLFVHD